MTVAELGQRLSSAELSEWMAFFRVQDERARGIEPPQEFDDPKDQAAALDRLLFPAAKGKRKQNP